MSETTAVVDDLERMFIALQIENSRLRTALQKYGDHLYECELKNGGECSCGYEAAFGTHT